jgi:hypothetical protein
MDSPAATANARLHAWEAQALVRTWFHELGLELAYAEGDMLIAWASNLVVEAQILPLRETVQLRWNVHHASGWLSATLAAETHRGLQRRPAADGRWSPQNRNASGWTEDARLRA